MTGHGGRRSLDAQNAPTAPWNLAQIGLHSPKEGSVLVSEGSDAGWLEHIRPRLRLRRPTTPHEKLDQGGLR